MSGDGARIQEWNGSRWHILAGTDTWRLGTPTCGWDLMTCASATNCFGFGFACPSLDCGFTGPELIPAAWDGSSWSLGVGIPFTVPDTIACAGRGFCMMTSGPDHAAVTHDPQGGSWQAASPDLTVVCHGAKDCTLAAALLSCGNPDHCMALPPSHRRHALPHPP